MDDEDPVCPAVGTAQVRTVSPQKNIEGLRPFRAGERYDRFFLSAVHNEKYSVREKAMRKVSNAAGPENVTHGQLGHAKVRRNGPVEKIGQLPKPALKEAHPDKTTWRFGYYSLL